ncbi:hypothetical protein, partial [Paraburkholderia azotifigens]|uniref:hypothetical protein n=1 Tax=Paraburkholderia azotifigens TaxID=2057004 RepID=UPI003171564B
AASMRKMRPASVQHSVNEDANSTPRVPVRDPRQKTGCSDLPKLRSEDGAEGQAGRQYQAYLSGARYPDK